MAITRRGWRPWWTLSHDGYHETRLETMADSRPRWLSRDEAGDHGGLSATMAITRRGWRPWRTVSHDGYHETRLETMADCEPRWLSRDEAGDYGGLLEMTDKRTQHNKMSPLTAPNVKNVNFKNPRWRTAAILNADSCCCKAAKRNCRQFC